MIDEAFGVLNRAIDIRKGWHSGRPRVIEIHKGISGDEDEVLSRRLGESECTKHR